MSRDQNCWPSRYGFRIGHLNINHVFNKSTDVTTIISNSGKQFHLFGFSESRLRDKIPSPDFLISDYTIVRKDTITNNKTDLLIYISDTISYKHLSHLAKSFPILVGFCYRNPACHVGWLDAFTKNDGQSIIRIKRNHSSRNDGQSIVRIKRNHSSRRF